MWYKRVVLCLQNSSCIYQIFNNINILIVVAAGSPVKAQTIDYKSSAPFLFTNFRIRATPQAWRLNLIDDANSSLIKAIQ